VLRSEDFFKLTTEHSLDCEESVFEVLGNGSTVAEIANIAFELLLKIFFFE
jgi:hypothetical protein